MPPGVHHLKVPYHSSCFNGSIISIRDWGVLCLLCSIVNIVTWYINNQFSTYVCILATTAYNYCLRLNPVIKHDTSLQLFKHINDYKTQKVVYWQFHKWQLHPAPWAWFWHRATKPCHLLHCKGVAVNLTVTGSSVAGKEILHFIFQYTYSNINTVSSTV